MPPTPNELLLILLLTALVAMQFEWIDPVQLGELPRNLVSVGS